MDNTAEPDITAAPAGLPHLNATQAGQLSGSKPASNWDKIPALGQ